MGTGTHSANVLANRRGLLKMPSLSSDSTHAASFAQANSLTLEDKAPRSQEPKQLTTGAKLVQTQRRLPGMKKPLLTWGNLGGYRGLCRCCLDSRRHQLQCVCVRVCVLESWRHQVEGGLLDGGNTRERKQCHWMERVPQGRALSGKNAFGCRVQSRNKEAHLICTLAGSEVGGCMRLVVQDLDWETCRH
eukprot:14762-Pelagomonas_calceolata.AAC.2